MSVFKTRNFESPNFWQKIMGKQPKENGLVALQNLLATRPIYAISEVDVQQAIAPYDFNLHKDMQDEVHGLYRRYLEHCLKDHHLDDEELRHLKHLKYLLGLSDLEVQQLHRQVSIAHYRDELRSVLKDHKIDAQERKFLQELEEQLHLPEDLRREIYRETATERYRHLLEEVTADKRLSPSDQKKLRQLAADLNVDVTFDKPTQQQLERYRLLWQIEQGELPTIEAPIKLHRNEQAIFHVPCDWYELRTITKGVRYSGPTMRVKIAKGLYWRAGQLQTKRIKEDSWQHIDRGDMYLTNKRIIFLGQKANKTLRLNRILDFTAYTDGVELQKDRGRSPFMQFEQEPQLFAMLLEKAIEQY